MLVSRRQGVFSPQQRVIAVTKEKSTSKAQNYTKENEQQNTNQSLTHCVP
jgi:hypothetical protein